MRTLLSVGSVPVLYDDFLGRGSLLSCGNIDGDGSGDPDGDPDYQARTSYRNIGPDGVPRWLNADLVPYIVLPPQVIMAVPGIVLGCQAFVTNTDNGLQCRAIVGDVGPRDKIGEMSIACAKLLGVPWSPTTGGESRLVIKYSFWPGVAGMANGITYPLQRYALVA